MSPLAVFAIAYDLRDAAARGQARRHRAYWGRSWTSHHVLDADTVVLVFRSAGPRWSAWEEVRRRWILRDLGDLGEAAA